MISDSYAAIYAVVKDIPRGRVATYGQVADLAGLAGHARQVGYALHATPDEIEIPWQRVLNAKGEVSDRSDPMMNSLQQSLLEGEGVIFNASGRCDLAYYGWEPRLHSHISKARRGSRKAGIKAGVKTSAKASPKKKSRRRKQRD